MHVNEIFIVYTKFFTIIHVTELITSVQTKIKTTCVDFQYET